MSRGSFDTHGHFEHGLSQGCMGHSSIRVISLTSYKVSSGNLLT